MSRREAAARTACYVVAFLLTGLLGRLSVLPGSDLALAWPAAGVAALWVARAPRRTRALDGALLLVTAGLVNYVTGAAAGLAALLGVVNLLQALAFVAVLRAVRSPMWIAGGDRPLRKVVKLGHLLLASLASGLVGSVTGTASFWVAGGSWSWAVAGAWVARISLSVLVIAAAGQQLGYWLSVRRVRPRGATAAGPRTTRSRVLELGVLVLASVLTCVGVFGLATELPLSFLPLLFTVWVGARFRVEVSLAHSALVAALVIAVTTTAPGGVFGTVDDPWVRSAAVQAFIGTTVVIGVALSLLRQENIDAARSLAHARREAAEQAALFRTIIDTMDEGLLVVRPDGSVMLRNPAAVRLTGDAVAGAGRVRHAQEYGLYTPAGEPVADEDMAYARALRGETVAGEDVVLRNTAVPEGCVLNVVATPMGPATPGEPPMAVVVFRDVTADRRQRDELSSFAGVVAHDLLSPLTTVEGWSEALREELEEGEARGSVDVPAATASLDRIERGARRMRDFVGDLLAYTTAREAEIHPVPVALEPVVSDVALARVERAAGGQVPLVEAVLHPDAAEVLAEPVLLRQLLDNLVGNSLKYAAEGAVPHVRVSSRPSGHLVEVDVLDNGSGIPDGQHARVFERFARAHGAGHRGTGLGLAICRRIVERHGGTISAAPRPDGARGTLVRFTLPAVPVAEGPEPSPGGRHRARASTSRATSSGHSSGSQWPASVSTNR